MAKNYPPQAYTTETLMEAYDWLQHQPPSIRELARSANDAVSLFKQHHRGFHRKDKSEGFKTDLKKLAQGLKDFEGEGGEKSSHEVKVGVDESHEVKTGGSHEIRAGEGYGARATESHEIRAGEGYGARATENHEIRMGENLGDLPPPKVHVTTERPPPSVEPVFSSPLLAVEKLDEKTRLSLQIAKERLNLGSLEEAMRLLVALGAEKLKGM